MSHVSERVSFCVYCDIRLLTFRLVSEAAKIAIIAKLVEVNRLFHFVLIFAQLPLQNVLSNTKLP